MAEQGRSRQPAQHDDEPRQDRLMTSREVSESKPVPSSPQQPHSEPHSGHPDQPQPPPPHRPTDEQVNELLTKESDPPNVGQITANIIGHMQEVFSKMRKHFDDARAEAQKLPNSDELAALLANLNMAEVAMTEMVAAAERSLV